MYIEIKGKLLHHINIIGRNGEILLSSETYFNHSNAKRAAKKLSKTLKIPVRE